MSTQAVRKVWTARAQTRSAFQWRQFLESVTENVHSISNENTIVCSSPTAKHKQIQACLHMLPSYRDSHQIKNTVSKHCTSSVVWGKSLLLPLVSCAPEMEQDSRKLGLSVKNPTMCLSEITDPCGREETRWLLAVLPVLVRSSELQRLGKKGAVLLSFLKKTRIQEAMCEDWEDSWWPGKATWHGEDLPAFPRRVKRVIPDCWLKHCGGLAS